jgi:hypothetical protein
VLGFVRASVRARNGGCGSGSSLTLISPTKHTYQKRSQTEVNKVLSTSVSLDTRHNFRGWSPQQQEFQHLRWCQQGYTTPHPRNLSQGDFWDMGSANNAIPLGNNHWEDKNDECSSPSVLKEENAVQRHNVTPNTGSKIQNRFW